MASNSSLGYSTFNDTSTLGYNSNTLGYNTYPSSTLNYTGSSTLGYKSAGGVPGHAGSLDELPETNVPVLRATGSAILLWYFVGFITGLFVAIIVVLALIWTNVMAWNPGSTVTQGVVQQNTTFSAAVPSTNNHGLTKLNDPQELVNKLSERLNAKKQEEHIEQEYVNPVIEQQQVLQTKEPQEESIDSYLSKSEKMKAPSNKKKATLLTNPKSYGEVESSSPKEYKYENELEDFKSNSNPKKLRGTPISGKKSFLKF